MFLLQGNAREENAVLDYCLKYNIPYTHNIESCHPSAIPVGGVEFCNNWLGYSPKPDYYPDWLSKYLYRNIWETNVWPNEKGIFIKPADEYKRFSGFVTYGGYANKKRGPFVCADKVTFVGAEYRYYIIKGCVVCSGTYNNDIDMIPKLKVTIPKNWCGTLDFAYLDTGEFALIEAHHPFAVGWYGDKEDNEKYVKFLIDGWDYLKNLRG